MPDYSTSFQKIGMVLLLIWSAIPAHSRDLGQWEGGDQSIRDWYAGLKQPDNPTVSCCGESDAYWCDTIHVRGEKTFCKITDDREDAPRARPHVEIGTEIEIPNHKLKWKDENGNQTGNPTGHSIVFLSSGGAVFCFVQGALT